MYSQMIWGWSEEDLLFIKFQRLIKSSIFESIKLVKEIVEHSMG